MRIEELKYFVVTAECYSMTMASEVLHVSQQCISRDIKQLENELGVQLFNRSKKGVTLTKEGQSVYARAKKILKQVSDLSHLFEEAHTTNLMFGCYMALADTISTILNIYESLEDTIAINNIYFSTEKLYEEIQTGGIDIALWQIEKSNWNTFSVNEAYIHLVLLQEPATIVMNADNVEKGMTTFYLHTLKHYPIMFYCSDSNEVPMFERIAQQYGPLNILYKGNDRERSWKYIQERGAVALFTHSMYNGMKNNAKWAVGSSLKMLDLDETIMVYTVLSVKKELYDNDSIIRLISIIRDYFQGL